MPSLHKINNMTRFDIGAIDSLHNMSSSKSVNNHNEQLVLGVMDYSLEDHLIAL